MPLKRVPNIYNVSICPLNHGNIDNTHVGRVRVVDSNERQKVSNDLDSILKSEDVRPLKEKGLVSKTLL